MAFGGLSKLTAVNMIARAVGEKPFSALDSTGSWPSKTYAASTAGDIERILDEVTTIILAQGWAFNTHRCRKVTKASPGTITFSDRVLGLKTAGPTQWRNYVLRAGAVVDIEQDTPTTTFAAGDYFFDLITEHEFSDIPADVQAVVLEKARIETQRMMRGSQALEVALTQNATEADIRAMRPANPNSVAINPQPVIMRQQPAPNG